MAPKTQKTSSGKSKTTEEQKEDVLQALVFADTFETRFAPFTLERPRCLLPLANTPLIEYTLEFLANAGVHDVFLYGGSHTDQVERYINASKWKLSSSPFKKLVFLKSAATSIGDVMRDLDQKDFIAGDFITVSGDVVSNLSIESALTAHKARREKDKNAIMTMLLRETDQRHRARADVIVPTFVIDPTKDRCLHYEEAVAGESGRVTIDPEMLSKPELDIRQDLIDCRIDICTPDVLSLWSDNFDNQSPRKDFLNGVLKDYELNGKTIHTHILKDYYGARAGNLRTYNAISQDIRCRWAFPLSPDTNLVPGQKYKFSSGGTYLEDKVVLARSCRVSANSVIGQGSSIGEGSVVTNSVIGRRCLIGKNVSIADAYIWDDATIGDNVKILQAIIADEAVIDKQCIIERGALVSYGVRITNGRKVRSGAMITKAPGERGRSIPSDKELVGENGEGYQYKDGAQENESASTTPSLSINVVPESFHFSTDIILVYTTPEHAASNSSLSSAASEGSEGPSSFVGSRSESFATTMSDEDGTERFYHEAVSSLFERMQSDAQPEDVRVELMGLRLGNNASEHQVRKAVAVALMKHIQHMIDPGATIIADAVKKALTQYRILVQRDQSQDTSGDQIDFLLHAQHDLTRRKDGEKILLFLAKDLYEMEIFGEEVFTDWWNAEESSSDQEMNRVRQATSHFIEWLANAESESESEDDSEE